MRVFLLLWAALSTYCALCFAVYGSRMPTFDRLGEKLGNFYASGPRFSELGTSVTHLLDIPQRRDSSSVSVLNYTGVDTGKAIKSGTTLRILGVGDSITVGYLSNLDGGDGNGYLLKLRDDLSEDKVVYAGTETGLGDMNDDHFAAWSGKTINYISEHVDPSLEQRPNIILLHAGTNDMSSNNATSTEGNDPEGAAERLGDLIDKISDKCPDAVLLVAMIINTCRPAQVNRTKIFQSLIPGVVATRYEAGQHVLAVDFTTLPTSNLRDCIHPTNAGYRKMGDYWHDFLTQVPSDWITTPVGKDPERSGSNAKATGLMTVLLAMMGFVILSGFI